MSAKTSQSPSRRLRSKNLALLALLLALVAIIYLVSIVRMGGG
jgi:hypothetical protein